MQIANHVFLLASGTLGCSISHPNDCNVYAVRCGDRFLLIDTGVGMEQESIFEHMAADGIAPDRIEAILITHGHLDHAGGAFGLHQKFGAPVFASEETELALRTADETFISLEAAKRAGIYGGEFRLTACPVERILKPSCAFEIGDCRITPIATPGHSIDMLSYWVESEEGGMLFPGDTVFHGGKILISDTWDCHPRAYAASLRTLARLPVQSLFPGHGLWSVREGKKHLDATLKYLDRLLLPPNLIGAE